MIFWREIKDQNSRRKRRKRGTNLGFLTNWKNEIPRYGEGRESRAKYEKTY